MKFIASYSGGKDSVLALHRAVGQGMQPVALVTTYNTQKERSWFHGVPRPLLQQVSHALGIPVWLVETSGEQYAASFEQALQRGREQGAQCCIFGDIDIEEHRAWCTARCKKAGLAAVFPLWGEPRSQLVREFIQSDYHACVTVVDSSRAPAALAGEQLSLAVVEQLEAAGVDACGENGEYHTFVWDGPLFAQPVPFVLGARLQQGDYVIRPLHQG